MVRPGTPSPPPVTLGLWASPRGSRWGCTATRRTGWLWAGALDHAFHTWDCLWAQVLEATALLGLGAVSAQRSQDPLSLLQRALQGPALCSACRCLPPRGVSGVLVCERPLHRVAVCWGGCLSRQLVTVLAVGAGPYLGRNAAQASGITSTAGVCACGPRDGLIVEDGERELAVRDEHRLERVDLPRRRPDRVLPPFPLRGPAPSTIPAHTVVVP